MHLYLLWGNSKSNKDWVYSLGEALRGDTFSDVYIQEYDHRKDTENLNINIDLESEKLYNAIQGKDTYTIVAKSAWCLVVLNTMKVYKINPHNIYLIGFPIWYATEILKIDLHELLHNINYDKAFHLIQQSLDPAGTPKEVEEIFSNGEQETVWHFFEWDSHFYEVEVLKKYILN